MSFPIYTTSNREGFDFNIRYVVLSIEIFEESGFEGESGYSIFDNALACVRPGTA
jgi:hypothetical protein